MPPSASARPAPPDVFAYLDHRAFLGDWFEHRKAANPRFSHRVFMRLAGQGSPSLLHQVIHGKRNLTEATCRAFCKAMKLDRAEREFFELLVQLDAARTEKERSEAWDRVSANRRFRLARSLDDEAVRYLSKWYYPAIRELASCPQFVSSPTWISRTLRPRITTSQARAALKTLEELGLLAPAADGTLRPTASTVVTPHEVTRVAVFNYHAAMLARAEDAMDTARAAERHMGGVTVAISRDMVPQLKREIAAFQERLLDLCDGSKAAPDQVYQLSLQLFPLSRSIGS